MHLQGQRQKAGPLKAFEKHASDSNLLAPEAPKRERSPKRMAPSIPTSSSQSAPGSSKSQSAAGSNMKSSSTSQSAAGSSILSSTVSQSAAGSNALSSTASQSAGTNTFASSVMSAVKSSSGSKGPQTFTGLTKPLSVPTAPPRRKHGNRSASEDRSRTPLREQKSRDDTDVGRSTPTKSSVKASPFATVGKMWRPMSMTSSASTDHEETYQTYNNFDVLREMTSERLPLAANPRDQVEDQFMNGHAGKKTASSSSKTAQGVTKSFLNKGSVSEKSFALLKEKVSANHSNTVKKVLDTVYTSEDFCQATSDIDRLLNELKQTMDSLKSSRIDKQPVQFNMCKDELQTQVRQFVTDAKLLVSNATQTKNKLAVNMDASMHSLAKIFLHGQATMFMMEAVHQAQHLGSEVMRVANAYKSTLNAAHAAVGKPLSDPHMKYLMRQATNLASLLSTLLKSLKTLEQK